MTRKNFRLGLALAVVIASLGVVSSVQARVPVEPGPGSPVSHSHPRLPARVHAKRRLDGGFPALSGVHVKVLAEARTE